MHQLNSPAVAALLAVLISSATAAQHKKPTPPQHGAAQHAHPKHTATCPVMKTAIKDTAKAPHLMVNKEPVYVCCPKCISAIKQQPAKYLKQIKDPVNGKTFIVTAKTPKLEHGGALYLFSSQATYSHGAQFLKGGGKGHGHGDDHSGKGHGPAANHSGHAANSSRSPALPVGQEVPDFSVTDLSGKTLTLSDLQKKSKSGVVTLTYWCSFCHSCRHLEKRLDEFARQQADKATVVLVDASAGETAAGVSAFARKTGLTLPILLDAGGKSVDLFGVRATTTTLVIDANRVLRYRGQFGHGNAEPGPAALKAVLAGETVAQKETTQRG